MDNYDQVLRQMEAFGVEFTPRDLPLQIPTPKRKTCGKKGKFWYWLQLFQPRNGGCFVVGRFGTYKHGGSDAKVDVDWKELSQADRDRMAQERAAAAAAARAAKVQAAEAAARTAQDLWRAGARDGVSPYLQRKGVRGESCRYLATPAVMRRQDRSRAPIGLPAGTLMLPLVRYDLPREVALRGLQFIKPDGFKIFTEGFAKSGCALRLGDAPAGTPLVMVCEGYATGLSVRQATDHRIPLYVGLDAYNLQFVVPILRALHVDARLLICADDDWKSADHDGANPGRRAAMKVARQTAGCDIVWPVFGAGRLDGDTDFNDLQQRQGIETVARQLRAVLEGITRRYG